MNSKVALFKTNGDIMLRDFFYNNDDFDLAELEILIEDKGNNFEIIEQGYFCYSNKYYYLLGYKSGNNFSKHEFQNCYLFDDAIMVVYQDTECIDINHVDINNYYYIDDILSESSISFDDESEDELDDDLIIIN